MFQQLAFDNFLKSLDNIQFGCLELLAPNGRKYFFEGKNSGLNADITIHDKRVVPSIIAKGDIGFAEEYRDNRIDSSNISYLMQFIMGNQEALNNYTHGTNFYKYISKFLYLLKSNTIKGSKRNIHAHYDLGNDFYKLWLDETMTYSSAIFTGKNQPLEIAQNNKYDRILGLIGDKPSNILEIGCGWGGFSERAITQKNHNVRAVTISEEQHKYATERLSGYKENANVVLEDYRKQEGKFDNIVSIEMFEAVGEKYWNTYFLKIASLLKDKGKAVIQTITIRDELFKDYRKSGDMIRSFIFPGGMLPSPERFKHEANKAGLKVNGKFFFGKDYALTLDTWLNKFDAQIRNVKSLGFDEKFIRIWRLYLATCIAGFTSGRTDVMQVELSHA